MIKDPIQRLWYITKELGKDFDTKRRAAQLGTIGVLMYSFVTPSSSEVEEINYINEVLRKHGLGPSRSETSEFSEISIFNPGPYIRTDFKTSALEHEGILRVFSDRPTFQSSSHWARGFELDKLWVFIGRTNENLTSISFYRKSQYPTIQELEKGCFPKRPKN